MHYGCLGIGYLRDAGRIGTEAVGVLPPRASHGLRLEQDCRARARNSTGARPRQQRAQLDCRLLDGLLLAVWDRQIGVRRMAGWRFIAGRCGSRGLVHLLGSLTPRLADALRIGTTQTYFQ